MVGQVEFDREGSDGWIGEEFDATLRQFTSKRLENGQRQDEVTDCAATRDEDVLQISILRIKI
jgi:hypothetical protein